MVDDAKSKPKIVKYDIDWPMVLLLLHLHVISIYALFCIPSAQLLTLLFGFCLICFGLIGTMAGAHRFWAHGSYKADLKLRIFLMLCQTLVGEGTIYNWVLVHRLHHKYFGTSLDPFNTKKSLFLIQIASKCKNPVGGYDQFKTDIDMSDVENDCIVMFQKKFYWLMYPIVVLLLPINAPAEYWGEDLMMSFYLIGILRYLITLHLSWLVNSAPKIWKCDPHNSKIMELIDKKEWLSYHHLAPWDYQASEWGSYGNDFTSKFIRFCSDWGMATHLKTMNGETVGKAVQMSAETGKSIAQCLSESHSVEDKNS